MRPAALKWKRGFSEELDIPVMHDDQHGTAVMVMAGLGTL